MRLTVVMRILGFGLLLLPTAVAADPPDDLKEAVRRRKQAEQAWRKRTSIEAYEKVGRKNPKWDASAREALTRALAVWNGDPAVTEEAVLESARKAVAAGCDDPLILYVAASMTARIRYGDPEELSKQYANVVRDLGASAYHPLRKSAACLGALNFELALHPKPTPEQQTGMRVLFDSAAALIPEFTRTDPPAPGDAAGYLADLVKNGKFIAGDRKEVLDRVLEAAGKAWPNEPYISLVVKGATYIDYAWDARGIGLANTVKDEGWKLMQERLEVADDALERAWAMDHAEPSAPTQMIGVELGQGKGRDVMERWWQRAMDADPDNVQACRSKRYYLEPKWYGSPEEMLKFGRQCLAGGNWKAGIPFVLINAHDSLIHVTGHKPEVYLADPAVWKDIQTVFETYLKKYPKAILERTQYASWACSAGRWDVAHSQFKILGDTPRLSVFRDQATYDQYRKTAAENVGKKPGAGKTK